MSKEVLTKEINAGFLVIVLLAGTFAAISSSFMVGAQAEPYYGMDNNYNNYEQEYGMDSYDDKKSYGKDSNSNDKSKDSSNVIEKKIKCNNINVNVNGFNGVEVGTLPTALNGLATDEAQATDEGEIGASSFGSGGSGNDGRPSSGQGSDKWCINNNKFVVVEAETPEPEPEEPLTCEECFGVDSALQAVIAEYLVDVTIDVTFGFNSDELTIPGEVETIEGLCPLLKGHTDSLIKLIIEHMVETETTTDFEDSIAALIKCLLEAGVIVEEETPQGVSNIPGGVINTP